LAYAENVSDARPFKHGAARRPLWDRAFVPDTHGVSVYRLTRAIPAQVLGLSSLGCGLAIAARLAAAAFDAPGALLTALQVVGVASALAGLVSAYFTFRPPVVLRLSAEGFLVRWVRGAGVRAGRWAAIEDVTADQRGLVALRHRDGRVTYIPLTAVGAQPAMIQSDIASRLDSSRGYRRIR
jgi:hypothetical protein